ncbi:MAG: TonB-dependent receptor [Calditrichaeota bacterium]|nr:TonB-dependent receptor [Calditrichota bacterium]
MRPGTISLANMAMFAGLMVALGYLLSSVPNVELVTATAFVAGAFLGAGRGLATAMVGELLYAAVNPYGISSVTLLVSQVLGMGLAGFVGGLIGRRVRRHRIQWPQVLALGACGFLLTVTFDFLTTVGFLVMSRLTLPALLGAYAYGAVFYLTHAAANTAVFALLVPAALGVVGRRGTTVNQVPREAKMKTEKTLLVTLLSIAVLTSSAFAQVTGLVVDHTTGRPLAGANVSVVPGELGTATDEGGRFALPKLPAGTHQIRVSYMGYEPQLLTVRITEGGAQNLSVRLVPTVIELEEVMVTGKRGRSLSWELPVSAEVVSATDIEMVNGTTVADALRPVAGAFVKSYGSEAAMKSLSVRGSSAEQVLILWDGARLNSPLAGGYDLGLLPLTAVERIEFVRSGLSSLYGADAAGGVVNIITRAPQGGVRPQLSLATSVGSWGSRSAHFAGSHQQGDVGVLVAASRARSDGDFVYRAKDQATGRETEKRRINNSFSLDELFAKLSWQSSLLTRLTLSGEWSRAERGAPGSLAFPSPQAQQTDESRRLQVNVDTRLGGTLHIQATGFRHELATRFVDPNPFWPSDADNRGVSAGASVQGDLPLGEGKVVSLGASYLNERSQGTSFGTHVRESFGAFAQADAAWKGLLGRPEWQANLLPTVRIDHYQGFGSVTSPKVGIILSRVRHSHIAIRGNVGGSFRAPTFNDLYWPEDAFTVGNPNLKPERTTEIEGGLSVSVPAAGRLHSDLSVYRRWARDLIVWGMDAATYKWSPANVSEAEITGQELRVKWEGVAARLIIEASYSHLRAVNAGGVPGLQGKWLIYRPEHTASLRAGFQGRPFYCNATASYVGSRYTDEANTAPLPAHTVVDANAGVRVPFWGVTWHLRVAVDNLFDVQYQVADGYPMPGRQWRAGVEVGW